MQIARLRIVTSMSIKDRTGNDNESQKKKLRSEPAHSSKPMYKKTGGRARKIEE